MRYEKHLYGGDEGAIEVDEIVEEKRRFWEKVLGIRKH